MMLIITIIIIIVVVIVVIKFQVMMMMKLSSPINLLFSNMREVIDQKRVRVFHQGFQTPRKR